MKLRWYDRILVALSGLVLVALGVCVMLAAGGVITLPEPIAFDSWLGDGWQWMPLIFLGGLLVAIWGLWLLIRPFKRTTEGRGKYYTLQDEKDGNVRISVNAIDHLVRRCIDAYGQVVSAKVRIGGSEDAMLITLHMTVSSDVRIPSLVEELREDIKRSLQHSAGVTVETVEIYVDATRDDKSAKDGIKYIEAPAQPSKEAPADDFISTTSFYTTPVVVTDEPKQKAETPVQTTPTPKEPAEAEMERDDDWGAGEPFPADLSAQAFPFPEEDADELPGAYTEDMLAEDDAQGEEETEHE